MADSWKTNPVGRIVDTLKRILDPVLPGTSRTPAPPPEPQAPIPSTPPPRLLRTPAPGGAGPATLDEPQASPPPSAGLPGEVGERAAADVEAPPPPGTATREMGAKGAGEAARAVPTAAEPGTPPESVAGMAEAERPDARADKPRYEQLTKAELYQLAQHRDIPGRSTMSKRQLVEALRRADRR